jgi:hypothetical protein
VLDGNDIVREAMFQQQPDNFRVAELRSTWFNGQLAALLAIAKR